MVLLLAALAAYATPAPIDLIPLKSGSYVHLQAAGEGAVGRIGFIEPREEGASLVVLCPISDPARWRAWADYFAAIGQENLPSRVVPPDPASCGSTAAYGTDEKTRNVVELTVQAPTGALATTVGRREATVLSERIRSFADRGPSAPVRSVEPSPGFEAALRLLYLARGWSLRTDDPGYRADLAAVQAAGARGVDVSELLHKVWSDRRLRPGALADLAPAP